MNEKIHLYGNYYFHRHDKLNFAIIERKLNKKTKEEYFRTLTYHPDINGMLKTLKRMYVLDFLIPSIKNNTFDKLLESLNLMNERLLNEEELI